MRGDGDSLRYSCPSAQAQDSPHEEENSGVRGAGCRQAGMRWVKVFRYFRHYTSEKTSGVPTQLEGDRLISDLLGDLRGKHRDSLEQQYFHEDGTFEYLRAM